MHINSGIPTIGEYQALIKSDLFIKMETFSNDFIKANELINTKYNKKWIGDPLHTWSRQWEYPFTYTRILKHINYLNGENKTYNILDAGSGITFFPYFINSNIKSVNIFCCDFDPSLEKVFSVVNKNYPKKIDFNLEDLNKLSFKDKTFDIIYCISVMEHMNDFESVIKEFKRLLKANGILILTFDISIDGVADIPPSKAEKLLLLLSEYFYLEENIQSKSIKYKLKSPNILTTRYIKKYNKSLLPWKHPFLSVLKSSILKFRLPKGSFKNLTIFCGTYKHR